MVIFDMLVSEYWYQFATMCLRSPCSVARLECTYACNRVWCEGLY